MSLKEVKWIFFDLGETLIDETPPIDESIRQFVTGAAAYGYSFTPETVREAIQQAYREFAEFPMRTVMERLIPSAEMREAVRRRMKYRKDLDTPFPESEALLEALSRRYRIGIIANQGPGTAARLEAYGWTPYISVCCASAEAGFSKPDPRLFRMALEEASCPPGEAVMIGDRIDNDILPAKQLGMKAVWVRQGDARYQPRRRRAKLRTL
ncbi:HAD family hydrolase [Paenibacillus sp. P26]|nr:HAD family hydrolase [Paenibacillus sp. P26]